MKGLTPGRAPLVVAAAVALYELGEAFGYLRTIVAFGASAVVMWLGMRRLNAFAQTPPDEPPADVSAHGLRYVCTVCGLELRLEIASKERAPSHCMERMVLVQDAGPRPGPVADPEPGSDP